MRTFDDRHDFMAGLYRIRFADHRAAEAFVSRFSACPVWPVVVRTAPDEALVLAIELVAQRHGDFSPEANTLVRKPALIGAEEVLFVREDTLLKLFPGHSLETGTHERTPCGSECETCGSFRSPCRGCPAVYAYT